MRRVVVACVVGLVLGGGGIAGAFVKDQLYTVQKGQEAKLVGTQIYCQAYVPNGGHGLGKPTFDCSWWGDVNRVPGAFSVDIGAWGIDVEKWDSTGKSYNIVASYLNR